MAELARFLFQKGHFSAKNKRVKPGAFNPGTRKDLSVFYVAGIGEPRKRLIAAAVSTVGGRDVKARAEILLSDLGGTRLSFVRDNDPIWRHGNLVGWTLGDDDAARMDRVEHATALASRVSLHS